MCSIVQYNTVQYIVINYNIIQYLRVECIVKYCTVLLCTEQYVRIFILLSENNAVNQFQRLKNKCRRVGIVYFVWPLLENIGQLPRVSGKDPERKEWTQLLKRVFFIYSLLVCLWANFLIFLFQPSLFIQYSTEECSTVQVFIYSTVGK